MKTSTSSLAQHLAFILPCSTNEVRTGTYAITIVYFKDMRRYAYTRKIYVIRENLLVYVCT